MASPKGERDFNPAPLLPRREKGLGDEGRLSLKVSKVLGNCTSFTKNDRREFSTDSCLGVNYLGREASLAQFKQLK